jgi:hypothetical protein
MRVVEGISYELSDSSWQKPEVELNDADFERLMVDWDIKNPDVVPIILRYQVMSAQARFLLTVHMIQQKRVDTKWLETEGKQRFENAQAELDNLQGTLKSLS